jgi:hypothetical protein
MPESRDIQEIRGRIASYIMKPVKIEMTPKLERFTLRREWEKDTSKID